jgi:hypothetical protein
MEGWMPKLVIAFNGMVLLGHGDRGEGWLVDTSLVKVGHKHVHVLDVGLARTVLPGGSLLSFESGGERLRGALELGTQSEHLVDLDAILPTASLRAELTTDTPQVGDAWSRVLAAWIRLPGGRVTATPKAGEVWTFDGLGERALA